MAGAIAQDREGCHFPVLNPATLNENPAGCSIWRGYISGHPANPFLARPWIVRIIVVAYFDKGVRLQIGLLVRVLWRCLSGIAGLLAGGFFGMAAMQLLMLLFRSDFGLSNVRPGFIVGGVIGFLLGVYLPQKKT